MTINLALKAFHIHLDYDGVIVDKLKNIPQGGCIDCWSNHLDTIFATFKNEPLDNLNNVSKTF